MIDSSPLQSSPYEQDWQLDSTVHIEQVIFIHCVQGRNPMVFTLVI